MRSRLAAASAILATAALAPTAVAAPAQEDGARHYDASRAGRPAHKPHPSRKPSAGARSAGDRLFPQIGNGGYDALHYDIRQSYEPATGMLRSTTTMTARANQRLSEFSLDLQGLAVSGVAVDGRPAAFTREASKLIVDPRAGSMAPGRRFDVQVSSSGVPGTILDPDGSSEGWFRTDDGAFVVGEPIGSQAWFPSNNTPRDKASFAVQTTVPAGVTVVGNGSLVGSATAHGRTTWRWREDHPMSTYLATTTLGRFDVTRTALPRRVTLFDAVDTLFTAPEKTATREALAREPGIVRSHTSLYGPYPFDFVGAAVDRASSVGYALESQSISNYDRPPAPATLAHEIAHQWFGDAVTPKEWVDIWLNEGFATWIQWDWSFRDGSGPSPAALWAENYARPEGDPLWTVPPANPRADEIFDASTYTRGAMTLDGLRQIVGDATYFRILRTWQSEHRYGNVTTADFTALAERVSRRELTPYFQDWLYESGKPSTTPANYRG